MEETTGLPKILVIRGNILLLFLCWILISLPSSAQNSFFSKVIPHLSKNSPENIYLHLDKSICLAGDTIWFKGYILEGNTLSKNSTSLNVEFFDKRGYLIYTRVFPIYSGITFGQLEIPDHTTPDIYYIRAYTRWQCNFNTHSLYQVPVTIIDSKSNNVSILKHINRNKNQVSFFSDDINVIAKTNQQTINLQVGTDNAYYIDSVLSLFLVSAGATASVQFTLTKEKPLHDIVIPVNSRKAGHEVDLLVMAPSGQILWQDKIFFPATIPTISIITDTLRINDKGFNSWRIHVKDTSILSLSVSITDAEVDTSRITIGNSISSSMINYADIRSGKPYPTRVIDSNYISCKGIAYRISKNDRVKNKKLFAFISTKDSLRSFQIINIDSVGRFDLKNLFFHDTATIQFQLQDKHWRTKDVDLRFDWFNRPVFIPDSSIYVYTKRTSLQNTPLIEVTRQKELFASNIKVLPEVKVAAKIKSVIERMDEEYTTGAFRSGINSRSFDVVNEPGVLNMGLLTFLQTSMPGIEITRDSTTGLESGLKYRKEKMIFFLNEFEVDYDQISGIPVSGIAYVKVFPPPFVMSFLMQGAVCVYTKKGSELEIPDRSLLPEVIVSRRGNNKKLDKQYASSIFAQPADFSLDLRTARKEFDLYAYLADKLPGFTYIEEGPKVTFKYFNNPLKIYIDEWEVDLPQINMYRHRVNWLAYVKVIGNFVGIVPDKGSMGKQNPALVLYTRKDADLNDVYDGLNKTEIAGYNRVKLPANVNYADSVSLKQPDNRICLYWNPFVKSGITEVKFYNNDFTRKFKVIIEGISIKGDLLHFEEIIEPAGPAAKGF